MTTTVWVKLEFTGRDAEGRAHDAVEQELDAGALQEAINGQEDDYDLRLTSATVCEPEVVTGRGVAFTKRQLHAAACAVSAMLAGEDGAGDWPEDVTRRDLAGAGDKLGVR